MKILQHVLTFVFFLSGLSSLLYQVAWQRLLTVYYGVGPISTTLIVTIFMLGLGLGALCGGALAERVKGRVLTYTGVEFLLGCFGLISLPYLDFLGGATAGASFEVSAVCMTVFLFIPTLLMGMTLPLIVKIFGGWFPDFLRTVAYLYFINTLGAAAGALIASYGIISFLGIDHCIYIAAAINLVLACLVFVVCRRVLPSSSAQAPSLPAEPAGVPAGSGHGMGRMTWLVVLVTGFLAIGYEILWFRVIEVLVKASSYSFSTVLAVYLCGIALGSYAMHRALPRSEITDRRSLFFLLQVLTGCYVALSVTAYYYLTVYTPLRALTRATFFQAVHPSFELPSLQHPSLVFAGVAFLAWPLFFVFVPTLLLGASFPLIASLALSNPHEEGRTVGRVYFFNTVGNVLGGFTTGFVLLPLLNTERTLMVFITTNVLMGLFVATLLGRSVSITRRFLVVVCLVGLVILVFPRSGQIYAAIHFPVGPHEQTFQKEGVEGVVYTYQDGERVGNYINGQLHGGRPNPSFLAETVEALACARQHDRVLIIGFGTGSFVEAVERCPEVQSITMVELNDTLIRNLRRIPAIRQILANPRLNVIIDDGRRFLLRTEEKFNLILIDPLYSTTAYSNNLYSRQFFELVKRHLAAEGVFLCWMNELRVLPKTIQSVFPYIRCYSMPPAVGFDIASNSPLVVDEERRREILSNFTPVEQRRISGVPITFLGESAYAEAVGDYLPINEDWRPVCEYYLGLKVRLWQLARDQHSAER
jgi:predicted membrane-bound spermidine synthase